jgi:hypothetical protein
MVTYKCDFCGRIKDPRETWILGFAAENIGITQARREVAISAKWDDVRAVDWLAVHFCSVECKDKYMDKLFNEPRATSGKVEVIEEEPEVVLRREPGTLARAMTEPPLKIVRRKKKPAVTRKSTRRRVS